MPLVSKTVSWHRNPEEVEVDESYFGARRVKGKKGRGANGKTIVFGLLKRGGNVYTEIVPDCKAITLTEIIKGRTNIDTNPF